MFIEGNPAPTFRFNKVIYFLMLMALIIKKHPCAARSAGAGRGPSRDPVTLGTGPGLGRPAPPAYVGKGGVKADFPLSKSPSLRPLRGHPIKDFADLPRLPSP